MNDLEELNLILAELGIKPEDLVERFIRAQGKGGQHVNKTSTAVQLSHAQSGLEVRAEGERSQLRNRIRAREILIEKIKEKIEKDANDARNLREKKRRQHRRPSLAARRRNVEKKRQKGEKKRLRGPVKRDE